jgi:hypothetical protein
VLEERARLLMVGDWHVRPNAALRQRPQVLTGAVLAVSDRPLDVQMEAEAGAVEQIEEGLVVLDIGGRDQDANDDAGFAAVHGVVGMRRPATWQTPR